jgi:Flp pilus assembly protein TadG
MMFRTLCNHCCTRSSRRLGRRSLGRRRFGRRLGATAVETAMVMVPMIVFLTGVFEYGRFLMDRNVLNNAAREGCRYALANNTALTINSDVSGVVTSYLGREVNSYSNLSITVTGTHAGASTAVNNLVAGDYITVTVSGTYQFMNIIPLVPMPTLTVTSAVTMTCEGAT